jgi:WD40 repeat protein
LNPFNNQVASIWVLEPQVTIWDALSGQLILTLPTNNPGSISWNPDGDRLATGGQNIRIWSPSSGQLLTTLSTGPAREVNWSPDGTRLAGVEGASTLKIWDALTGSEIRVFEAQAGLIHDIVWHPDSEIIAVASSDGTVLNGTVRIWDTNTSELLDIFQSASPVYAVDWSPDGTQLVYGGGIPQGGDPLQIVSPNLIHRESTSLMSLPP